MTSSVCKQRLFGTAFVFARPEEEAVVDARHNQADGVRAHRSDNLERVAEALEPHRENDRADQYPRRDNPTKSFLPRSPELDPERGLVEHLQGSPAREELQRVRERDRHSEEDLAVFCSQPSVFRDSESFLSG